MRRLHLLTACLFGVSLTMAAQSSAAPALQTLPLEPTFDMATYALWDGAPAGATGTLTPEETPTITVFRPPRGRVNGSAVIIAPGGAYLHLSMNLEGRAVADWFTVRGVTAFVLKYRMGPNNLYPIPLLDAQRAIRLVRSHAQEFGLQEDRIGFMGFSAGGHLAAETGVSFDDGDLSATDAVSKVSDRPDFLILGYPWLNAMQPNDKKMITYCSVLKTVPADKCKAFEQLYTPSLHVTSRTPPTFIYSTFDDQTVPIQTSVEFYSALIAAGVPSEIHIFRHGRHGSGLGVGDPALDQWPDLLEQWMRDQGWLVLEPPPAAQPPAR